MATQIQQQFAAPAPAPAPPLQELPRPFAREERPATSPQSPPLALPEDRVSLSAAAQERGTVTSGPSRTPPQTPPEENPALAPAPPGQETALARRGTTAEPAALRELPALRREPTPPVEKVEKQEEPPETVVAETTAPAPNPPAPVAPPATAATPTPGDATAQSQAPPPERQNAAATDSRISARQTVLRQEAFAANEPVTPFTRTPQPFQPLDITV